MAEMTPDDPLTFKIGLAEPPTELNTLLVYMVVRLILSLHAYAI